MREWAVLWPGTCARCCREGGKELRALLCTSSPCSSLVSCASSFEACADLYDHCCKAATSSQVSVWAGNAVPALVPGVSKGAQEMCCFFPSFLDPFCCTLLRGTAGNTSTQQAGHIAS